MLKQFCCARCAMRPKHKILSFCLLASCCYCCLFAVFAAYVCASRSLAVCLSACLIWPAPCLHRLVGCSGSRADEDNEEAAADPEEPVDATAADEAAATACGSGDCECARPAALCDESRALPLLSLRQFLLALLCCPFPVDCA